jgi:UDP:flavonoid glycosyltransferase YjiC (YdhE family)
VDVHRFLPHAEVMPKVTLLVGHGGHSTTMQALAHDLPMVVMPLHPMLDHPMIGAILKERGVATVVKKSAPPERIREAVLRMLSDGPHRRAAAELGRKVRSGDGAIVAADELEELTRR